jgi:OOP family OmpA-OmpF porin
MKKCILGVSLVLAAGSAMAGDHDFDDRWYVTPSASFVKPDSNRNVNSAVAAGLAFGKFFTENVSVDLEFDKATFDNKNDSGELSQKSVSFISRYHFADKMGMRPYLGAGIGALRFKNDVGTGETDAIVSLVAGITKDISDRVDLRTELRYRLQNSNTLDTGHDTYDDYLFNAGLNISFGQASEQATNTTLVTQAPATDGDGDGVSDANDKCPNTPAGTQVDSSGCALVDGDDDQDGVANSRDKCPNSKAGAVVDNDGCEVQVVIELQGVHFDTDKSTLKPVSISILDAAVKTLGDHGTIRVEVAGHTDSTASDAYNQALSERRAKVVYEYLTSHGISADRMTWAGYGESQPIADNDTKEGRAKNRRTELIVQ